MYKNRLPIYDPGKCRFFALGRNAMYAACKAIGPKEGDRVLTPAFDCDGALQPFRALGLETDFYRSDPYTFDADIRDIRRRITPKTRLLHVVNHFGFPQPWDEFLKLRRETGVPILEDNAYSLFSSYKGKPLGSFGDFAIFSLRKNLPLADGGMLRVNNPNYEIVSPSVEPRWFYAGSAAGALSLAKSVLGVKRVPEALRRFLKRFRKTACPPPPLRSKDGSVPEWPLRDVTGEEFSCDYLRPMSRLAAFQLSRLSAQEYGRIMAAKRGYYKFIAGRLSGVDGVKVLHPDPDDGTVPFCVSALIESGRDACLEKLQKKYAVMAWPTLPGAVIERLGEFPEVALLGRKLLQINLPAETVTASGFEACAESILNDLSAAVKRFKG